MDQVTELIGKGVDWHVPELLVVMAIVMVLIDYVFPTDWPCQLGYCFAGGAAFFLAPFGPVPSLVTGISVWLLLALGHFFVFGHILKNTAESNLQSSVNHAGDVESEERH